MQRPKMINMIFKNTICLLAVSLLFSGSAFAASQRSLPCREAYQKVSAEGANPSKLSLEICKSRCEELPEGIRALDGLNEVLAMCISKLNAGSISTAEVATACSASIKELAACKGGCRADYDACNSSCSGLATAIERTEAFRKCNANYTGKPATDEKVAVDPTDPKGKEEPVDPTDPKDDTVADDPATDPADNNTGDPNTAAQMAALEGLGKSEYPSTDIGTNDASAIDFSSGPSAERNSWQNAISGAASSQDAQGYVGLGHNNYDPMQEGEVVSASKPGGNNGGSNNGGGTPPGLPITAQNNNGQNSNNGGNGAGRRSGGGSYRNSAADYLSRHSPFSFQSGPQSNLPGNNTKRNVAGQTKKKFGPIYKNKENDGKEALHRLFGNGLNPNGSRNPYNGLSGRACSDGVVFCRMENFYYNINKTPNHDINPDAN